MDAAAITADKIENWIDSSPSLDELFNPRVVGGVVNASGAEINTTHANDYDFYEELNAVIQYEPARDFWLFMVYDGQTRPVLETGDHKTGGLDSSSRR